MLRQAKVAAVSAAALLLAAMPAFAASNYALVRDNNVTATAVSGGNSQNQENDVEANAEGKGARATVYGGNAEQLMFTGHAYAGAEQTIVANVDACCSCDRECGECHECDLCGCNGWNKAIIKYNDVTATAVSGDNYQNQENEVDAQAESYGYGHGRRGKATATVDGGNNLQLMQTGDSQAWAAQWIVVNSQGSF